MKRLALIASSSTPGKVISLKNQDARLIWNRMQGVCLAVTNAADCPELQKQGWGGRSGQTPYNVGRVECIQLDGS